MNRPALLTPAQPTRAAAPPAHHEDAAYGLPFWFSYGANTTLMVAISLLYRYADLVSSLGGNEFHLGWIVGTGMVGSLVMRLAQGLGIDRYGPRIVWLGSAVGFILSCLGHLAIQRIDTPPIYLLRILLQSSVAGVFGASITYVSRRAPLARMAEVVGTLGTSGFIGMMLGPLLGDLLCGGNVTHRGQVDRLFIAAAGLGTLSALCGFLATRGFVPPTPRRHLPLARILRRSHPGAILLVGAAMGFGLSVPPTFLRPFTEDLGIQRIAPFFWVYAPTAFITRMSIRRLPERVGVRPMIHLGMASLVLSTLAFLGVRQPWQLVAPAVLIGFAHALLFPSVVAGGTVPFPLRYRGVGTTLMLAMFDLGALFGAPLAGGILSLAHQQSWPPYPTMFLSVALILAAVGIYFATAGQRVARR